jgi:hypothetical protein
MSGSHDDSSGGGGGVSGGEVLRLEHRGRVVRERKVIGLISSFRLCNTCLNLDTARAQI